MPTKKELEAVRLVREILMDPKVRHKLMREMGDRGLKEPYRSMFDPESPKYVEGLDPYTGFCSMASDALRRILGGEADRKFRGYQLCRVKHGPEGFGHFYLRTPRGEYLDPTASQFKTPVPYDKGRGVGLPTTVKYPGTDVQIPTQAAQVILDAARARRVASRYIAKQAGLLQPPPKMVDAITAWAEANTAATRLESGEGDDTLSESELREIARRGKGEAIPLNGEIVKMFPIDLRGWKYGDRLEKLVEYEMKQVRGVMQHLDEQRQILQDKGTWDDHKDFAIKMEESVRKRLKEIRSQRIRVVLKHVDSRRKGGDWSPALGIMTILITPYSPLSEIRQTVKHELTHLAQDLLTKTSDAAVKDLHKNPFGLPSRKIRTPWYKAPHRSVSDHSMDDREFYPKLADAVDEMRAALDRLPPEQHRDAFRKMVGEKRDGQHEGGLRRLSVLPFFLHLSRAEEGKWGKAVSVAYGELFGGSSSRVASRYVAKQAGLLKAPPKMVKEIAEWAVETIAEKLFADLMEELEWLEEEYDEALKEGDRREAEFNRRQIEGYDDVAAVLMRYARDPKAHPGKVTKKFKPNLSGWPYKVDKGSLPDLPVTVVLANKDWKYDYYSKAVYDFDNMLMAINASLVGIEDPKEVEAALKAIPKTIRHELQHYAQDIMSIGLPEGAKPGQPKPRVRDPGVSGPFDPYSLNDKEYHPLLTDEVESFVEAAQGLSRRDLNQAVKDWTAGRSRLPGYEGVNKRFWSELSRNRGKWQEATKTFYKEVMDALTSPRRVASSGRLVWPSEG